MAEVTPLWKPEPVAHAKGRARPDEPLADICEISVRAVCTLTPAVRHHRKLRAHGGGDEQANTLDACDPCHDYVHANPAIAYHRGWLIHSWAAA